ASIRVVNRDDPWSRAMGGDRPLTFGLEAPANDDEFGLDRTRALLSRGHDALLPIGELGMPGLHNAANALAAHALAGSVGAPRAALARAMREFKGLPHRVELVAEAGGGRFYGDSKGTN